MKTLFRRLLPTMETVLVILFMLILPFYMACFVETAHADKQDLRSESFTKVWMGPDGNPLPFANDDEICDFLRTAKTIQVSDLTTGITKPKKLLLEKDGIQACAIFHFRHIIRRQEELKGGEIVLFFRDSYYNNVAAYELSRLLGIPNVAPSVLREINGKKGSVQMWIENAITERDRAEQKRFPPDQSIIKLNAHDMRVFDNLINNIDRNLTNILYDPNWNLWFIDHTRAFGRDAELPDKKRLQRCSRPLWTRLQSLDDQLVFKTLEPYMSSMEIKRLLDRRDKIIKHFKKKIKKEGDENILFNYGKPE